MTKQEIKKSNDSIAQHIGRHKGKYLAGAIGISIAAKAPYLKSVYDNMNSKTSIHKPGDASIEPEALMPKERNVERFNMH